MENHLIRFRFLLNFNFYFYMKQVYYKSTDLKFESKCSAKNTNLIDPFSVLSYLSYNNFSIEKIKYFI